MKENDAVDVGHKQDTNTGEHLRTNYTLRLDNLIRQESTNDDLIMLNSPRPR
uniref:Uncharacterized protein n=1 Tax=Onchocerca volvulus TaxID=6282 RepID=A0A8R1Y0X4_ONCVO